MGILFGGSGRVNKPSPPASALRIQTSLSGQPIAVLHGQQRIAGNCIWYGGFTSSGGGSGKGGVFGGGKGQSETSYTADLIFGLCEGPIDAVLAVWNGKTLGSLADNGLSTFAGAPAQPAWGFMSASFPEFALGYSWLAYLGADPMSLGASPELPNLNYEVRGAISCALTESYAIASPYQFTATYFTLASSVTEQVTIPATSPYQLQAQNWNAQTALAVVAGQINANAIVGSTSQGVIDANGRVFSRVGGTPTTGQYGVGPGGLYTFAAADAGLQVTIVDLALSPGVNYCYRPSGNTVAGSLEVSGLSSTVNLAIGQLVLGPGVASGTVVQSVAGGSVTLSQPATATANGITLVFVGAPLTQVLGTPGVAEFSISVQPGAYGEYQFAAVDNGKSVLMIDIPDANPADSLTDYLSNPRYGCGFPASFIGDLTQLENYAYAAGLFVSPALTASQSANDYLNDFATGLNGEFVWSAGTLTFLPYGDAAIVGFGKNYTPPSAAIYSLDDDDFLPNEGTASVGVSAFTSDDPVVCVRKRPSDAYNDVRIEYLDRGSSYNPAVVEAQDDAAINQFGLRPADTKQLHFFCMESAALMSAQLQLGRQQVRNQYCFTVPWYFILLDPMDIVEITDAALGLVNQWVRIIEIAENQQDGTLTVTAEDCLAGTGNAPNYGSQTKIGYTPNYNISPGSINPPILFEPPAALVGDAPQIWAAVSGGSGGLAGPNWGGCEVWLSFDADTYQQIGVINGPAKQGVLAAGLAAPPGLNPDTADTLVANTAMSGGVLPTATAADGANARTLGYVDGELIAYGAIAPARGDTYDLTDLYRGLYTSCAGAHSSGAPFVYLDQAIFKYDLPANAVGKTMYFKFPSFNIWGGGLEDLAAIEPVTYVPTGSGFAFSNSAFMAPLYSGAGNAIELGDIGGPAANTCICGDIGACVGETLELWSL